MACRKTVTLPEGYQAFAHDEKINVSKIAREALKDLMDNHPSTWPTRETRYEHKTLRSSVNLHRSHVDFVNHAGIDLSQVIREQIAERIDAEYTLQWAEENPGDSLAEIDRNIIDMILRCGPNPQDWS